MLCIMNGISVRAAKIESEQLIDPITCQTSLETSLTAGGLKPDLENFDLPLMFIIVYNQL